MPKFKPSGAELFKKKRSAEAYADGLRTKRHIRAEVRPSSKTTRKRSPELRWAVFAGQPRKGRTSGYTPGKFKILVSFKRARGEKGRTHFYDTGFLLKSEERAEIQAKLIRKERPYVDKVIIRKSV